MGVKITLPKVVLSYPHLFEARSIQGGKPKFSAAFLLDLDTHAGVIQEVQKVFKGLVDSEFKGVKPERKLPMKLGATKYPDEEFYANMVIINASSFDKPFAVDHLVQPVMDPGTLYPGCIVNAAIDMYAYRGNTGSGLTFGLTGVQYVGDGERLDNRPAVDDVFGAIEAPDAAAAPADLNEVYNDEDDDFAWAS